MFLYVSCKFRWEIRTDSVTIALSDQEKRALDGHSMPANAPSFLLQPKSWNSEDSLPTPILAGGTNSTLSAASSQPSLKRRREAEGPASKKKRRSKKVISDDEGSEEDDNHTFAPASSEPDITEGSAPRKSTRTTQLLKRVALDDDAGAGDDADTDAAGSEPPTIPPSRPPSPPAAGPPSPLPEDDLLLPEWLKEAESRLHKFDLDVSFTKLVTTWVRLEATNPGGDGTQLPFLPATKRPAWVTYWIARGRGKEEDFTGKSATKLEKDWWNWWIALQPAVRNLRVSDALLGKRDHTTQVAEDEWGSLNTRGINGLLSVLMALGWWGTIVFNHMVDWTRWLRAVHDVSWVMQQLKL